MKSLLVVTLTLSVPAVDPFAVKTTDHHVCPRTLLKAQKTRSDFLQESCLLAIGGGLLLTGPANADDGIRKISECKTPSGGKASNCVSSSSVKLVDCYVAPWEFDVSAEEAQARLKGVFAVDPSIYKDLYEEKGFLRVNAVRGLAVDQLEFIIDEKDKLVRLRSGELTNDPSPISDFGANRRRLDSIRKEAGVFEVMGGSYDSIEARGTGPVGQLKAFYGLQSGDGFKEVLEE